jgi:hypothetical protein
MSRSHFAIAQKPNGHMPSRPNKDLTDVYEVRRENLRKLIEQWGGPKALGIKLGYKNASFLVQMAGPNPNREITEATSRKIEQTLDLPAGWMDQVQAGIAAPVPVDHTLISRAIKAVVSTADDMHVTMEPNKLGDVVSLVYDDAETNGGTIRADFVRRILQLLRG